MILNFECSNYVGDIHKTIKQYIPNKKRNILIFIDDMTADTLHNKKLNKIVTE